MDIHIKVVEEIPDTDYRRGPRESKCADVVRAARTAETGKVEVTMDSKQDLEKFYKSLIQWKSRHTDEKIGIKKDRNSIYVWVPDEEEEEAAAHR